MELPIALTENLIERGAILHSDIFADIDHGKFFAIIGVDKDFVAGFFSSIPTSTEQFGTKRNNWLCSICWSRRIMIFFVTIHFWVLPTSSPEAERNFLKASMKEEQVLLGIWSNSIWRMSLVWFAIQNCSARWKNHAFSTNNWIFQYLCRRKQQLHYTEMKTMRWHRGRCGTHNHLIRRTFKWKGE